MTLKQKINSLCTPARFHLALGTIGVLILIVQNMREPYSYKVGSYKVPLGHHNVLFFIVKVLGLAFWTWLLQWICSKGHKGVAWALVAAPWILLLVVVGLVVVLAKERKGPVVQQAPVVSQGYAPRPIVQPQQVPMPVPPPIQQGPQQGSHLRGFDDAGQKFNWKP